MKTILIIIISLLLFSSCDFSDVGDEKIHGNGKVQTNKYNIDGFFEITTNGAYNIIMIQDSTWDVIVEAESNILPLIELDKRENTLVIENSDGYEFDLTEPINVTVHHRGLDKVSLNGAGNITGDNTNSHINFFISGAGNITANIDCNELDVSVSGVGDLSFSGNTNESYITISGTANVFAQNLEIKKSWNTISGEGNEYLNVSEELHIDISGVGYVYYWGDPVVSSHITGVGNVVKKQ